MEAKVTLRNVNRRLAKYNVEMVHDRKEGYYYFVTDIDRYCWQMDVESLWTYNLEGFTMQRIIDHVLHFQPKETV